jgi:hypothetical protein
MAARRRKTVRRRKSTRRRRLGALPVYPNAMGIMGTSAMLGPVTVGLAGTQADHQRRSERIKPAVVSAMQQLEQSIQNMDCGMMVNRAMRLARKLGEYENEYFSGHQYHQEKIVDFTQKADKLLDSVRDLAPKYCRR